MPKSPRHLLTRAKAGRSQDTLPMLSNVRDSLSTLPHAPPEVLNGIPSLCRQWSFFNTLRLKLPHIPHPDSLFDTQEVRSEVYHTLAILKTD